MGLFRRIVDLATKTDPLASWGERVVYLVLFLFGPSTISALVLGGLSWLASNVVYGALVGLGAFALTQVGLTLLAVRRSATRTGPFAEPVSEGGATRALSSATSEEAEQLSKQLTKAEQKIEELQIELNNRPPRHFNTPVEVVETLTPAKAKEIEELKAENERLRKQVASPEVAKQKKLCLYLADELRALYESFEQDERVLMARLQKRKSAGATTEELEEERQTKQAAIEKRVLRKYHRGYSDRLEKLYNELEPDSWLGPNDEDLFLNVNMPHEIVLVANRLAEVGDRL